MAVKFSQFVVKTTKDDVEYIVGYNGTENVQITPANFLSGLDYVPYTGANNNVDLGTYGLISDYTQLNNLPTSVPAIAGTVSWNDTDGTMDIRLKGGNVTLQVGQEILTRVVNKTGADLLESNYQVVRVRTQAEGGAQGQRLAVKLAQADTAANHTGLLGLVTENIINNEEGFITNFGQVRQINTTGSLQGETWSDGTVLWLSATVAGGLTNIEPTTHPVQIGYVEYAHAINGKIFVSIETGVDTLSELHDVDINALTLANNDLLQYNSATSSWVNRTLSGAGITNIYNSNGTLTGNRTVTMNSYTLSFEKDLLVNGLTIGKGLGNIATNTAIGVSSLQANTTGANNTSVGYQTLYTNTTGQYNTAIGQQALYSFNGSGASYNTAVGYRSSYSMTSGITNTSLGYNSLYSCTTSNGNTAIGYNSLTTTTTGAGGNTAIGNFSLNANTTGSSNTAIGSSSSHANTTGTFNTSIGNGSSRFNTTGQGNSSVGYQTLYTNTTGGYNTAIGHSALYTNSTGSNSTAVGFQALYLNIATSNTAVGYQALRANSTALYNTAVGYQSLLVNTTGAQNTAVGFQSLFSNTTGISNTSFGTGTLNSNTTGTNNTAIGNSSLLSNSTGSYNIAIGDNSLSSIISLSNNTAIGYASLSSLVYGNGNNVALGNYSLAQNFFGSYNTAIGVTAGQNIDSGSGNIVIGGLDSSGNYYPVYDIMSENDYISMGTTSTTNAYIQVAWTVVSDKRDKTNFKQVPHGLDFVSKLKPTSYQFRKSRDSEETNGDVRYGFLAQDILELEGSESVVIESKDSEKLRYNESSLIPILVNAIKELKAEIETLKNK